MDPLGKRTIGVLTKLDLMDHGTNALDILAGRVYPLKLGFIGCVNRSQQDIQAGKSLEDALQSETDFFKMHPAYKNMSNKCGTMVLAKTLNTILMQHIREKLPDIKARLNTLMGQTQQELASYGGPMTGKAHRGSTILQLMTRFANSFISSIDGTSSEISIKELCGGARIYQIFHAVFGNALGHIDPTHNLSTTDIRTAIRNSTGPRASLFVPELAFDLLVKPQISLLEPPSQRCVELVYEELMKICHSCGDHELARYPKLQMRLIEVVSELLRERLGPTSAYVESLIAIERAYINTNHPNFLGGAGAMSTVLQQKTARDRGLRGEDIEIGEPRSKTAQSQATEARSNAVSPSPLAGKSNGTASRKDQGSLGQLPHQAHAATPLPASHASNNKDGFLTYFFGSKEQELRQQSTPVSNGTLVSGSSQEHHYQVNSFSRHMDSIVSDMSRGLDDPKLTDREQMETDLIRSLISSYFDIVRETIADQVPKAVMHLLVNFCRQNVQNRLVSELYREELFDLLLFEDENIAQERDKCSKMLAVYSEANKIIQEVL